MNREEVILGIDTSNYTTSLAIMNLRGDLITEKRKNLFVKEGSVGLRQSDAFFQHIKELPNVSNFISSCPIPFQIVAVSSAIRPRPLPDSYMPVFVASESFGKTISHLLNIPFYGFSHQEGHIQAGLWSLKLDLKEPFLALHISGGTTEILNVLPYNNGYNIDIIGGSSDISAGQFIDRIGVKLGLPFPCGAAMEKMIDFTKIEDINIPFSIKGNLISFSGPETYVQNRLKDNIDISSINYSVFMSIGKALYRLIITILKEYNYKNLLIVGGVASNTIIRNFLGEKLSENKINAYFGQAKYCTDNAVGIASLGVRTYIKNTSKK